MMPRMRGSFGDINSSMDLLHIKNKKTLYKELHKEAIFMLFSSILDADMYMEESILSYEDLKWLLDKYITLNKKHKICVSKENLDIMVREIYKYALCRILNKQVDEGIVELCWDKKKKDFFWRKKI